MKKDGTPPEGGAYTGESLGGSPGFNVSNHNILYNNLPPVSSLNPTGFEENEADWLLWHISKKFADITRTWYHIAIAHKNAGGTLAAFVAWSKTELYQDPIQAERAWHNLKGNFSIGTLKYYVRLTEENAFPCCIEQHAFNYKTADSDVNIDGDLLFSSMITGYEALQRNDMIALSPVDVDPSMPSHLQAAMAFRELYDPNEWLYVGSRYLRGEEQRLAIKTAGEWTCLFERDEGLDEAFVPNPHGGLWMPTKEGNLSWRADACFQDWRYLVLEMDDRPLNKQLAFAASVIDRGWDIRMVTYSGGKSLHLLMAVDGDCDEKKELFRFFSQLGFDPGCSHPGRLTRLPGAYREDKNSIQELLYLSEGKR